ncbi:helix-turn-helix domain-containing protein [Bifidobacterium catulorum]|uniref:Transcriptional regulator n=1 Tax=Bifidobacterium catulorum TaxID=1630173 RepID=A0A2U2MRK9_9BIFI|nr:helix-turn-helix transcriptional regulator [Bifidobacterium catulorum]PWG59472.1 transcriptional regulator [Bifidobacterium catulorum]
MTNNSSLPALRRRAFGMAVVQLRNARHLSQERLAQLAGIDRSYMGRIERGERSVGYDKIWAIGDALDVSFLELAQQMQIEFQVLQRELDVTAR